MPKVVGEDHSHAWITVETELKPPASLFPPASLSERLTEEKALDGAQMSQDPLNDLLFASWGPQMEATIQWTEGEWWIPVGNLTALWDRVVITNKLE